MCEAHENSDPRIRSPSIIVSLEKNSAFFIFYLDETVLEILNKSRESSPEMNLCKDIVALFYSRFLADYKNRIYTTEQIPFDWKLSIFLKPCQIEVFKGGEPISISKVLKDHFEEILGRYYLM